MRRSKHSSSNRKSSASLKSSKESFQSRGRSVEVSKELCRVRIALSNEICSLSHLGSYGVVFKAMRNDIDDTDENGNRR